MHTDTVDILIEKSKTKKDGVYKYQSYYYSVRNNCFHSYVDFFGNIYLFIGFGFTEIANVDYYLREKKFKKWFKNYK